MKQRIICKALAVAVIILFLGVGVQPAMADQSEGSKNNEEIIPTGSCILIVWTYKYYESFTIGFAPFVRLRCKDLDTNETRYGITGFFGLKFFLNLNRGHTYNISTIGYGYSKEIYLSCFINDLWLNVGWGPIINESILR